jgi:hypothetical protein
MEERLDFDRPAFQGAEVTVNERVKFAVNVQPGFAKSFLTWRD